MQQKPTPTAGHTLSPPAAQWATLPLLAIALVCYVGASVWTLWISLTPSRSIAIDRFAGLMQYQRLFANERWLQAVQHLAWFAVGFVIACLVIGYLLAVVIDGLRTGGGLLRLIFLYPYALSFIATGLAWQWMLDPAAGIQAALRSLGFADAVFDWLIDENRVMYAIAIAAVWQAAGLVMIILLAGLRGIDPDLRRAARVEGIPLWRFHASIVLPLLWPSLATAGFLLLTMVVKLYDVVVAMTRGGPGLASDVPAKFIMDHLFERANLGLASAATMVMLATVVCLGAPLWYLGQRASQRVAEAS